MKTNNKSEKIKVIPMSDEEWNKHKTECKSNDLKKEYYILAGIKGMKKKMEEAKLNLTPPYFMIINENSKIGRLIKKESKRRLSKL